MWISLTQPPGHIPKIWAFGGFNDVTGFAYTNIYTSTDGVNWTTPPGAALPAETNSGGVVVLGAYMYYIGGDDPTSNFETTHVWASLDGVNWNTTSYALPAVRGDALTLAFQGCLFEIGGTANDEGAGAISTVLESCDGGATWVTIGNIPNAVFLPCGVVYNNQMWLIGGASGGGVWTRYNQVYSSSNGITWNLQGTYPLSVYSCKATVFNNAIYVAGGNTLNYNSGPNVTSVYESVNGATWNFVGNLPAPRANGALISFKGNLIYIAGAATTWETGNVNTVFSSSTGGTGTWTTSTFPQAFTFFDNVIVF
jgi:hypothetical protein